MISNDKKRTSETTPLTTHFLSKPLTQTEVQICPHLQIHQNSIQNSLIKVEM